MDDVMIMSETEENMLPEEKKLLLVDYFQRTVGTGEEEPYFEMVVYALDDGSLIMERYADGGTLEQTVTTYDVPAEVYERALEIIRKRGLEDWNQLEDYQSLDGVVFVIRYYDGEKHLRVSSGKMPGNGLEAFREIKGLLLEYTAPQYWHIG